MGQLLLNDGFEGLTITAIEVVATDPLMRRVKIGRKTIATIHADDVENLKIAAGNTLTGEISASLEKAQIKLQIHKAAKKLINHHAYSQGELINKLKAKYNDSSIIKIIVDDLRSKGAIDDEAYGRNIALSLVQRGPISQSQLKHKLCNRHIKPQLAHLIAEQTLAEFDPIEEAIVFARKRMRTMQSKAEIVVARRLWAALSRRGFDSETINIVMNKIGLNTVEDIDT